MQQQAFEVTRGTPHPLGPTFDKSGCNFSLFSEHASSVELLIFDGNNSERPVQVIELQAQSHRTFCFWHVYLKGIGEGFRYAYRVHGPSDDETGFRFDPSKLLLDPYAKGLDSSLWKRGDACQPGVENLTSSMRSVLVQTDNYDWQGDQPLGYAPEDTIIYEMHVKGFTQSKSAKVKAAGTFAGVVEKIPHLKALGITAIELLPVFEFDAEEILREVDGEPLANYWGYSTVAFFSPHSKYCSSEQVTEQLNEFRDMVKALHKAGIEVVLDVVFNHTDEGNHQGPTYGFKGLDNTNYYYLVPGQEQFFFDYTGCGNTFKCNHPIGSKFILDCLRFWVAEMHVDGFRFDEGSVLSRGENGDRIQYPPVLWAIEMDDLLSRAKVNAEAWDAAGLYEVGSFPGYRWATWNGRFRDDVRSYVKGDGGMLSTIASRICGSSDVYGNEHTPRNSVNFITAHDGFTLADLVSYNDKHNVANGENNQDGANDNNSWNCGIEGPSEDPLIRQLRLKQMRNMATLLMISQGIPMMLYGDEVGRSQQGNNNAYCQDNDVSWFDWTLVEQNKELLRFWQHLIKFRRSHTNLRRRFYFGGRTNQRGLPEISWHGCRLGTPDWQDNGNRALAFTIAGFGSELDIHVLMNMYWEPLEFELPHIEGQGWAKVLDTSAGDGLDIFPAGEEPCVDRQSLTLQDRSIVVLISNSL